MKAGVLWFVGLAVLLLLATLTASPAQARCSTDCRKQIGSEFIACRAACGKDKVCRQACRDEKQADLATCTAATNPTPPDCGETPTTTTTMTTTTTTMTTMPHQPCGTYPMCGGSCPTGQTCVTWGGQCLCFNDGGCATSAPACNGPCSSGGMCRDGGGFCACVNGTCPCGSSCLDPRYDCIDISGPPHVCLCVSAQ
jgi:hypothetical protein